MQNFLLRRHRVEKLLAFEGKDDFSFAVFSYASAEVRSSTKTLRAVMNTQTHVSAKGFVKIL